MKKRKAYERQKDKLTRKFWGIYGLFSMKNIKSGEIRRYESLLQRKGWKSNGEDFDECARMFTAKGY